MLTLADRGDGGQNLAKNYDVTLSYDSSLSKIYLRFLVMIILLGFCSFSWGGIFNGTASYYVYKF